MECLICKSNSGEKRISPGKPIWESESLIVEHAYPCALEGWMVITPKRHMEAYHDLTNEEHEELMRIQFNLSKALYEYFKTEKEYILCLAELEGFQHLHFHMVPKHKGFDESYSGTQSFQYLRAPEEDWIPKDRVKEICADLNELLKAKLKEI